MGPWWLRLWTPKDHKMWHDVLAMYHLLGMMRHSYEDRPSDYTPDEISEKRTSIHPGYAYMAVDVLVSLGYIKKADTPKRDGIISRPSYYITNEGRGAVSSYRLLRDGFKERGSVITGSIQPVSILVALSLSSLSLYKTCNSEVDKGQRTVSPQERPEQAPPTASEPKTPSNTSSTATSSDSARTGSRLVEEPPPVPVDSLLTFRQSDSATGPSVTKKKK